MVRSKTKIPLSMLFAGSVFIFAWEFSLVLFGDHGALTWAPLILGVGLFAVAYLLLGTRKSH